MLPENIIFFAIALNLIGHILYIKSVIAGGAKPNLASWFPWMLAPFVGVFFQLKAGAGLSVLPVFMAGFGPLLIMIAALFTRNGFWQMRGFDLTCLSFSLVALIFYITTHNLAISIIFAILSDALAFFPTFKKSWTNPESEYHSTYSFAIISNIVGLLIIKDWSFTIYSFGLYLIVFNLATVLILYRRRLANLWARIE